MPVTDDKELCERLFAEVNAETARTGMVVLDYQGLAYATRVVEKALHVHSGRIQSLTAALRESMKLVEWCADSDDAPLFIKFEARDWLAANNQLIVGE
jgi:hypothetical protein